MPEEIVIYEKDSIKITNQRAIFGEKTYAVSNITSVSKSKDSLYGEGGLIVMVIGIFVTLAGFLGTNANIGAALLGLLLAGGGLYAMAFMKPVHVLVISSSSGEVKAYLSSDEVLIQHLVEAVNKAIVQKG
jgi:hypothetical protein